MELVKQLLMYSYFFYIIYVIVIADISEELLMYSYFL